VPTLIEMCWRVVGPSGTPDHLRHLPDHGGARGCGVTTPHPLMTCSGLSARSDIGIARDIAEV
jgi:hypothetical protein